MEAIVALSLACNVFQLVEQAIEATRACKQIYERGSLEGNENLEELAKEVMTANKDLSTELLRSPAVRNARLTQLAKQAIDTASDLQKILNSVKFAKGQSKGVDRILKRAVRSLIKRGSIERLEVRLKDQEKILQSGLVKAIYISCNQADVRQSAAFAKLENGQQVMIAKFLDGNSQMFNNVVGQIQSSEARIIASHVASSGQTSQAVHEVKTTVILQNAQRASLEAQKRLLDNLHFAAIDSRQDFIETRIGDFGETYQWIFDDSAKHPFASWLRHDTGIFWINGLAASGKSSLVAFIYRQLQREGRAVKLLKQWAQPKAVRVLSFFFYRPSSDALLKTFLGFWRSMCYQLMLSDDTLYHKIIADDTAPQSCRSVLNGNFAHTRLTNLDLQVAFFYLLEHAIQTTNYFILIDGLDEFEDNQEQLIEVLERTARLGDTVKICCSSRPESLFVGRLGRCPSLRLQDLTVADMEDVCQRQLGDTPASPLIDDIVEKAQGIFLWLHLVVNDLRRVSAHDTLEELQDRLAECPSGMKGLFTLMLKRGDAYYLKNPKPYLKLMYTAAIQNTKVILTDLVFVGIPPEQLLQMLSTCLAHKDLSRIQDRLENLESQVIARTAGLIQFSVTDEFSGVVFESPADHPAIKQAAEREAGFIHRTAVDFLNEEQEGKEILSACDMSEQEANWALMSSGAASALVIEQITSWQRGDKNPVREREHDTCKRGRALEGFEAIHPHYCQLLDIFYARVSSKAPNCPLDEEEFGEFMKDGFWSFYYSPDISSFHNLAITCAGDKDLAYYASQKILELPLSQRAAGLAVLLSSYARLSDKDTRGNDSCARQDALAVLAESCVSESCSLQVVPLVHAEMNWGTVSLIKTKACLMDHVLASIWHSHYYSVDFLLRGIEQVMRAQVRDVYPWWARMSEDVGISIHLVCEVHLATMFLNDLWVGEVDQFPDLSEEYVFKIRLTRESLINSINSLEKGGTAVPARPKSIDVSPPGTKRFFGIAREELHVVARQVQEIAHTYEFRSGEYVRLLEKVLDANLALLSEDDIRGLKEKGWAFKDGRFDGSGIALSYLLSDSGSDSENDDFEEDGGDSNWETDDDDVDEEG